MTSPRSTSTRLMTLIVAGLVAGCSSSAPTSTVPALSGPGSSGPTLNGIYSIATGPYQEYVTSKTRPVDTYLAAFASTCGATGCVATQTPVDDAKKPIQGAPSRILDFVDGSWRWSGEVDGTCVAEGSNAARPARYFKSMTLAPQSDGALTGTLVTLSGTDPCHVANHAPVTLTRVADVESNVALPDPASLPAQVSSPATGLRGAYDYHYTDRQFAKSQPVTRATVSTYCVRTGTKCVTLLLFSNAAQSPFNFQVLGYADGHWTATSDAGEEPCAPGPGADKKSVVTDFALPKPPTDPITTLTGVETTRWIGPCPAERQSDIVLNRTGD